MSDSVTLQDAIVELQTAQAAAEAAVEKVDSHNEDENAHPVILNLLRKVINNGNLYTNEEIQALVTSLIENHTETDIKSAHPGWDDYTNELDEKFTELSNEIAQLRSDLNDYTSQGSSSSSDLNSAIQAILDKYSVILSSLQDAYRQAVENDQDALAESYKNSINETLEQQQQEIMEVIEEWQSSQEGGEATITIYIVFQNNGGSGSMATQYITQGDLFTLPECTFTAPEGYQFGYWSSNSTGDGTYTGVPGDTIDTSSIANSLTLYAIWEVILVSGGDEEEEESGDTSGGDEEDTSGSGSEDGDQGGEVTDPEDGDDTEDTDEEDPEDTENAAVTTSTLSSELNYASSMVKR